MGAKILCGWGVFSLVLLIWDWLLASLFGLYGAYLALHYAACGFWVYFKKKRQ